MTSPVDNWKRAAVEQWTADPCGSGDDLQPGQAGYFERLRAMRDDYAPWVADALGYTTASGQSVLDVGCGQGIDLWHFATNGAQVTGVDLTTRHVELAQQHLAESGLSGSVEVGDAESLPFEDATFDLVTSNGVLHHTPNINAALTEIHRVLRPGGEVRVILYNKSSVHYWVQQFLYCGVLRRQLLRERSMAGVLSSNVELSTVGARPLVNVYTPRQVRRMLDKAGFSDTAVGVRHFHPNDSFLTRRLWGPFGSHRMQERLTRWGWYVVGEGRA